MTSETETKQLWWHAFGTPMKEDSEFPGTFMLVILGPAAFGPDDDHQGQPVKEALVSGAPYLGSWDHAPSEVEKDKLRPEEFREYDAEGDPWPWDRPEDD